MDIFQTVGLVVFGSFLLLFALELLTGRLGLSPRPARDFLFMVFGLFSNLVVAGTLIGAFAGWLVIQLWPNHAGSLAGVSFWIAFPLIFLIEEAAHYWLHRASHQWRWLWKIHRTHHSAQHLNVSVVYRYNFFWVFLLPQTWMGAFAVYFGQTTAYFTAVLITFFVNLATHSSFRWDLWLRERTPQPLQGLWWVIERVITLPDTHHAHHAYGRSAHPNGNYAVTFFLFDVMFGTAKIPNARQQHYGLPISPRLHWAEELLWPVVRKPLLPKPASASPSDAA
ncbi:sterol desaturase family protein [Parahaliea aestuarii]|uniref:Sterol desaturase family protein n=1 Tax=Parahaliea aestuarii TaxID=1852021 RepID=A0A5C9A5W3_9GAMM|nr:sterol desaturase family protein [Parahaliea aestuarii]TXS94561.1 sterol desaturase family protein [Parahaliea aestuarii]